MLKMCLYAGSHALEIFLKVLLNNLFLLKAYLTYSKLPARVFFFTLEKYIRICMLNIYNSIIMNCFVLSSIKFINQYLF